MHFGVPNILSQMSPLSNNNYNVIFSTLGVILPSNINLQIENENFDFIFEQEFLRSIILLHHVIWTCMEI
jgi:hypothetical protein